MRLKSHAPSGTLHWSISAIHVYHLLTRRLGNRTSFPSRDGDGAVYANCENALIRALAAENNPGRSDQKVQVEPQ
jgi:hypothetical protein